MNTGSVPHIPEDMLERYAMGRLPDRERALLHEHLLICSACQISLKETDEYVKIMKAVTASLRPTPFERAFSGAHGACCASTASRLNRGELPAAKIPPERPAVSNTRGNTDKPSTGTV